MRRANYPQIYPIDMCTCGSETWSCVESRSVQGIRYRRHKCTECGKVISTREVDEKEWQMLCDKLKMYEEINREMGEALNETMDRLQRKVAGKS